MNHWMPISSQVWIVDPESMRTSRRDVKVGPLTGQNIAILEGLDAGELIVAAGVNAVQEGMWVRPMEAREGPVMLPSQFAIEKKVISWMLVLIFGVGGMVAFFSLGQLEDPPFTIKDAKIVVAYPGASPQQVEEEVTFPVEQALQQLAALDEVVSTSSTGLSQITASIQKTYGGAELQQVWDGVRRKIDDMIVKGELPPGTSQPLINDDFGDVFGMMFAVTGTGYSYGELEDYVDYLRRELILVPGVAKIDISGTRARQVFVEISQARMATLGISMQRIYDLLQTQNVVSNAGSIRAGSESVRINPTGEFDDVSQLEQLLISDPGASELIYLGDVADISMGFAEVPSKIMRYAGDQALVVGISFTFWCQRGRYRQGSRIALAGTGIRPTGG